MPPRGFAGPGPGPSDPIANPYQVPTPTERAQPTAPAKRSPWPILVGLVAIVAVGAGAFWFASGDDPDRPSNENTPGAAVLRYLDALSDKDWEGACDLISSGSRERLEVTGESCPAEMARLNPGNIMGKADGSKIISEKVDGDNAILSVEVGGSPIPEIPMKAYREDGVWKAAPFGGDPEPGDDEAGSASTTVAPPPEPGSPGAAYIAFINALVSTDYGKACALVSSAALQEISAGGATCENSLEVRADDVRARDGVEVGVVTMSIVEQEVQGDRAQVTFQFGDDEPDSEPAVLVREADAWKVDLFAEPS